MQEFTGGYDFRRVRLLVDNSGSFSFFHYWGWQLNPFWTDKLPSEIGTVRFIDSKGFSAESRWNQIAVLGAGMFRVVVYQNECGETKWEYRWLSRDDLFACLWTSSDLGTVRILIDDSGTAGYLPYVVLGRIMPYIMLKHDAITFHGVLMEHEGRGIILSAPSGIGKTTHAHLWRDHKRALILNGDRTTCCVENGRWIGFSLPWSGTSGECIHRDVPLTAFVSLEQSLENSVERLTGLEAFGVVMPNLLYPSWDRELTEKALDFIDGFLEKVPVFRLRCRPDVDAVETLDRALREL